MLLRIAAVLALTALALGQEGKWEIISNPGLTINIGITFKNEDEGFLAGAVNGLGNEILHTVDGGHTWNSTQGNLNNDLLLFDCECSENTVIVTAVFNELYSKDDGRTFNDSLGGGHSQSIRYIATDNDGERFGCANSFFGYGGAAITHDGGVLFEQRPAPELFTFARYGAYPSENTWYITAGEFPQQEQDDDQDDLPAALRARLPGDKMAARGRKSVFQDEFGRWRKDIGAHRLQNTTGSYKAQLIKTVDGGKTWKTQFAQNDTFYFNGIDCTSETHCCAVGESMDLPFDGAGIWCTHDGETWNRTFYSQDSNIGGFSLIDIRFANENLGWAVGGELGELAPKAYFVETRDGGKTWDPYAHVFWGYYGLGIEVVNEKVAYAALDDTVTQQSGVAKWTA